MADVTLNAATVAGGKIVKTKTIGGKEHQRVNVGNATSRSSVSSTTDAEILAANVDRVRATFQNNADQDFLLAEGTTAATAANCTIRIPPGGAYIIDDTYDAVHGKFASAVGSGQLNVTEVS